MGTRKYGMTLGRIAPRSRRERRKIKMTKKLVRNVIIAGIALALLSIGILLGAGLGAGRHESDRQMWKDEKSVMRGEIEQWRQYFLDTEKKR
jgi:hypothetical protein